MNCEKAQKYLPDFRGGGLAGRCRSELEKHLNKCRKCRDWMEIWDEFCLTNRERISPPSTLSWESFDKAIAAELANHPLPGSRRFSLKEVWNYITGGLWLFPKRSQLRTLFAGAAAGFVIFLTSHIAPIYPPPSNNLTIGEYWGGQQQGGLMVYKQQRSDIVYFHENIQIERIGSDQRSAFTNK